MSPAGAQPAAAIATVVYLPHVIIEWSGRLPENVNQAGELARSHEGAMRALVPALDSREHDTEVHSLRVRAYSLRIGRERGMTEPEKARHTIAVDTGSHFDPVVAGAFLRNDGSDRREIGGGFRS